MSFGVDETPSGKNKQQLSLFDFKMSQADFVEKSSAAVDYDVWMLAHKEPEQSKTSRFLTVSAAVHLAALLAIAVFTVPLVEQAQVETITIEIEEPPAPRMLARGARTMPTQGGTPVLAKIAVVEKVEDIGGPDDVVVAKAKPAKSATAKIAKLPSKAAKANVRGGAKSVAAKTNFKAVPMTIDDIEAPQLDEGDLASTNVASNLNEDFNDDFDHIDQSNKSALEKEKKAMASMAAALDEDQNEQLNSLEEMNNEEAAKLAAAQNSLRKKNSDAIASALASEKAAALASAREKALQDAKAKRAGLGGNGNGRGMADNGRGAGNSGSPESNNQVAGAPQGIRSLDQLRQMPGNPRPQYDREERRRGHQGEIAFVAYISKEGQPTKFRMMKSTGFANLDTKTLDALKKWRFYPGQEGWVELPFRWDLRGGMQQDGGLLRRSVSRR